MSLHCTLCRAILVEGQNWAPNKIKRNRKQCSQCLSKYGRTPARQAYQAAYRANRRDAAKEAAKKWQAKNPERCLWQRAKIRATDKGIPFDIHWSDIVIPTHCPALGIKLQTGTRGGCDSSPSLDRIRPEEGYVKNNIVVISNKANKIKSSANAEEVYKVAEWLKKLHAGVD